MRPPVCSIVFNPDYEEFRVPHPNGTEAAAYYTTDRTDARNTARAMWPESTVIRFKRKRESAS